MKNTELKHIFYSFLIFTIFFTSCGNTEKSSSSSDSSNSIEHIKIYYEDGRFAAWPANNGVWNWGDEILVGYVEAEHMETSGLHTYNRESTRNKYARSFDGGHTWTIEDVYDLGQTGWSFDNNLPDELAVEPTVMVEPIQDFTNPDFMITWMRNNYHNGPSIFYYSNNRGHQWYGPFKNPDLDTHGIGTRTDYIVDGPQQLSAFHNSAKENGREGRTLHARTTDGGVSWERVSWLGDEDPSGFEIMSSTIRLSDTEIYSVLRGREVDPRRDFLKAYRSFDNGETWTIGNDPVVDTGSNGSPPALLQMEDGRLALAYAYRSQYGSRICLRISNNDGQTWSHEIPVRTGDGANADIGYPRMVEREDGKLVIIYYWNHAAQEGASPYRYIAASIVDPSRY